MRVILSLLFASTVVAFAFVPPARGGLHFDRVMLGVLCVATLWHALLTRAKGVAFEPVMVPVTLLAVLAVASAASNPYDAQSWSVTAAKYVVPIVMFGAARYIFTDDLTVVRFFQVSNILLVYLTVTAIVWLAGAHWLVFPRFILDDAIGIHSDRARGPFLQAVANGMGLTMLGLLAWYRWESRPYRVARVTFLIVALPMAVVATLTRGVWFTFACAFATVILGSRDRIVRVLGAIGATAGCLVVLLAAPTFRQTLAARAEDSGPIEFRVAVYKASLTMFAERPVMGVGTNMSAMRLREYVRDYKLEAAPAHNTYLEVLLEHGLLGLVLYVSSLFMLARIGRHLPPPSAFSTAFLTSEFLLVWRALLLVFIVNSMFVIMNYQYINALLFSVAGIVRAQEARARSWPARSSPGLSPIGNPQLVSDPQSCSA